MNKSQIENHLRCAVNQATPNVLDHILTGNLYQQDPEQVHSISESKVLKLSGFKALTGIMAACLVLFISIGGLQFYNTNYKISSVIELDVNPSIEMTVNKSGKVLRVEAVNQDAIEILGDMELKGVELKVAINAIIGSMVQHGYLDHLENSILVTVTNNDAQKAEVVRKEVVTNIEASLKENQVTATVFDQQVKQTDELTQLAAEYGISYGKASFIQKLIEKEPTLTMADLAELSISEIADLIKKMGIDISDLTGYDYAKDIVDSLEGHTESNTDNITTEPVQAEENTMPENTTPGTSAQETTPSSTAATTTQAPETTTAAPTEIPATEESVVQKVRISLAYYSKGIIRVYFEGLVSWKNPTVSVSDDSGDSYPAMITDYQDDYCDIYVSGMKHDGEYAFAIGGVKNKKAEQYTTATGTIYIYAYEISEPETTPPETTEPETTQEETLPEEEDTKPAEAAPFIKSLERMTSNDLQIGFSKEVVWAAPIITVTNESDNTYVVSILEKNEKNCIISIDGLEPGHTYTIKIAGVTTKESAKKVELITTLTIENVKE